MQRDFYEIHQTAVNPHGQRPLEDGQVTIRQTEPAMRPQEAERGLRERYLVVFDDF